MSLPDILRRVVHIVAPVNRSRFAILGMLSVGSASGYEIRQRLEERVAPFWQESYGQIYPLLSRLVDEGLVEASTPMTRGRVFSLTPAGHEALVAWLRETPAPERSRVELLLKMFLGTEVPRSVLAEHVKAYRARLEEELARFRASREAILDRDDDRRVFSELTVSYGIVQNEAMLRWCDEALAALEAPGGAAQVTGG